MDVNLLNSKILNIDIFKSRKNTRNAKIPEFAEKILLELQTSLNNIREEALRKRQSSNEDVSKIINDLEISLNAILMKNLLAMKSKVQVNKLIKLGGLYEFASRHNSVLKKYLNSFYLTSRVYKGLLKNHPLMQDLQFRLLNVRRKVILETYKNECRKGKLHHLRSSKAVKTVSNIPRKLKYIVKKCNKEMMKCLGRDGAMSAKQTSELRLLLGDGKELNAESVCQLMEESLTDYYGRMQPDHDKTQGYIGSLMEICEAQNKQGEHVLLNYCDQEMAMEYLCLESEEVRHDYVTWESMAVGSGGGSVVDVRLSEKPDIGKADVHRAVHISLGGNSMIVDSRPPIIKTEQDSKVNVEETDVLDFEDFQLVDEWESRAEDDKKSDEATVAVVIPSTRLDTLKETSDAKNTMSAQSSRRRRRTRFGPVSEEFILEQMQQGNLGFSSTFVDEEENSGGASGVKAQALSKATLAKKNEDTVVKKSEELKMIVEPLEEKVVVEQIEVPKPVAQREIINIVDHRITNDKMTFLEEKKKEEPTVEKKIQYFIEKKKMKHVDERDDDKKSETKKDILKREMFDVVASTDEDMHTTTGESTSSVSVSRGDLCKSMLTQFHDTICGLIAVPRGRDDWAQNVARITQPWRVASDGPSIDYTSSLVESVAKEALDEVKNRLESLIKEQESTQSAVECVSSGDAPMAYSEVTGGHGAVASALIGSTVPQAYLTRDEESPSPTNFEQTIEANMTKARTLTITPWHPLVAPRPTKPDGNTSPDRTRLRAMMLSYKRDVKRQKTEEASAAKDVEEKEETVVVSDSGDKKEEGECEEHGVCASAVAVEGTVTKVETVTKAEAVVRTLSKSDSEGMLSSSSDDDAGKTPCPKALRDAKESKVQWLTTHTDKTACAPLPPPAATFLEERGEPEDTEKWTERKVFVVDAQDSRDAVAPLVKAYLHKSGAHVFDASNYKLAGKGLHVLVHDDWRFPEARAAAPVSFSSPVSLLFLKNNSGVHFLSYRDLDSVRNFQCCTLFPHSRTCVFLDHQALARTHPDNVRHMLRFMVQERESSDRVWCLKVVPGVYEDLCRRIETSVDEEERSRLKTVQQVLVDEFVDKYSDQESLALVEVIRGGVSEGTDDCGPSSSSSLPQSAVDQQSQVLDQQYKLQKKFRHFCVLTDDLNTTDLDMRYLSTHGVAMLSLRTFLTSKIKNYVD